ncbi:Transcriptional regulatory protein, C terminal [Formosa sp. Hel1_31_208]|uniref:winged helix-turn-helix domain-containing protein n=1 Tax=Formosa sp. Hel1_31_208 TaxID=1798225 RepID=UPI00087A78EE|nr:winged helix-turn-helix domain-containing protein [Formosa sp. Hel1_31_208]SDS33908.1 Transcriptional regulatory protein, C terminal [Formosa sp. Hel1_31_208]
MSTVVNCHEIVCYLQDMMNKRQIYLYTGLAFLFVLSYMLTSSNEDHNDLSENVKIAVREVGNQLLLYNEDNSSLILPVKEVAQGSYELSFEKSLFILPDQLVKIIDSTFQKSDLPKNYRIEVLQCSDQEVAYSYQIKEDKESTIIPCMGRSLPEQCYTIEVKFLNRAALISRSRTLIIVALLSLTLILLEYFLRKQKTSNSLSRSSQQFAKIGSFKFYPDQNKLVKEATEISLSKKECELLAIFISRPNEIIKRDELTKRVWEDNGVIVGRSLDTYISKLRKILMADTSIKLTNVHGVGYKLETI